MAVFIITDENGNQVTYDEYTTFKQAQKACISYSKKHEGKFTIICLVPSTLYEAGKEIENC